MLINLVYMFAGVMAGIALSVILLDHILWLMESAGMLNDVLIEIRAESRKYQGQLIISQLTESQIKVMSYALVEAIKKEGEDQEKVEDCLRKYISIRSNELDV